MIPPEKPGDNNNTYPRRKILAAAAVLPLAGCTGDDTEDEDPPDDDEEQLEPDDDEYEDDDIGLQWEVQRVGWLTTSGRYAGTEIITGLGALRLTEGSITFDGDRDSVRMVNSESNNQITIQLEGSETVELTQ